MLGLGADLVNLSQGELSLQGKPLCGDPSVPHRPSPLTERGSSAPSSVPKTLAYFPGLKALIQVCQRELSPPTPSFSQTKSKS